MNGGLQARAKWIALGLALCLAAAAGRWCQAASAAPAGRPNVVLILTDDQRWDAMGCAGHPFLKTPHMDRLAAEGVRFANMFCHHLALLAEPGVDSCRACMPIAHGVINNFTDYPNELPSFPRQLQARRLRDRLHRQVAHGREQRRRRGRASTTGSPTRARASTTTRSSTSTAQRAGAQGLLHHAGDRPGRRLAASRPRHKPFLLILGHKAPHSP